MSKHKTPSGSNCVRIVGTLIVKSSFQNSKYHAVHTKKGCWGEGGSQEILIKIENKKLFIQKAKSSSYKHKCCIEDTKFWPKLYAMVYISSEPNHSRRKTGDPPNNPKDRYRRRSEPSSNSHPNSTLSVCKLSGVYKGNTFGELPIPSSQFGKPNTYWCGFQPKIYGGVLRFRCQ